MAMVFGSGYGGSPAKKTTSPALRTDSQIDRRLVEQGRAIDPYTISYHTPISAKAQPTVAVLPRAQRQTFTPQPFKPTVADYRFGSTPTMAAAPWDPLGGKGFSTQAPQVTGGSYELPEDLKPYLIEADPGLDVQSDYGFGAWVDAIAAQLRAGQESRLAAAAEQQAARGMFRSGQAVLSEDAVRRETELAIAEKAAAAAVQQAQLTQETMVAAAQLRAEREMSNQRAMEAWNELQEKGREFRASLEQQAQIANQQAYIEMSGQAKQYASTLAELETRRQIANQQAQIAYEQLKSGYNQFLKELEFNQWAKTQELKLQGQNLGLEYDKLAYQREYDSRYLDLMGQKQQADLMASLGQAQQTDRKGVMQMLAELATYENSGITPDVAAALALSYDPTFDVSDPAFRQAVTALFGQGAALPTVRR